MDDERIISLYFARDEDAIRETDVKYGKYCAYIAGNILNSDDEVDQCVNDTYLNVWNSIPPQRPNYFKAFIGKITRNLALNRYDYFRAKKRDTNVTLCYEEFCECIPSDESPYEDQYILNETINAFLGSLKTKVRIIFMRRYWFFCSVKEIAESLSMSESAVKVTLQRTRLKFRSFLEREGIYL